MSTIRYICRYQSTLGPMTLASDGNALIGLWFDGQKYDRAILTGKKRTKKKKRISKEVSCMTGADQLGADQPGTAPSDASLSKADDLREVAADALPIFTETIRWLDLYFSGQIPDFTPALKVEGSEFRQLIAEIMLTIPYGQTMTYGEIGKEAARRLGKKTMSAQAVGGAVGHNPISIIIPCHRVMGADGSLTGYAGGLDRKLALLLLESDLYR